MTVYTEFLDAVPHKKWKVEKKLSKIESLIFKLMRIALKKVESYSIQYKEGIFICLQCEKVIIRKPCNLQSKFWSITQSLKQNSDHLCRVKIIRYSMITCAAFVLNHVLNPTILFRQFLVKWTYVMYYVRNDWV